MSKRTLEEDIAVPATDATDSQAVTSPAMKRARVEDEKDENNKEALEEAQYTAVKQAYAYLFTSGIIPEAMIFHRFTLHGPIEWRMWVRNRIDIDLSPLIAVLGLQTMEQCTRFSAIMTKPHDAHLIHQYLTAIPWRAPSYMYSTESTFGEIVNYICVGWILVWANHSHQHHYGSYELQILVDCARKYGHCDSGKNRVQEALTHFLTASKENATHCRLNDTLKGVLSHLGRDIPTVKVVFPRTSGLKDALAAYITGDKSELSTDQLAGRINKGSIAFELAYHSFRIESHAIFNDACYKYVETEQAKLLRA